ncbi:hypothetical protein VCHA37O177_70001 [Vibrio chagasii]|nr:hypothetical protein VCHA37O177_70001 [Vibrio chagasii]
MSILSGEDHSQRLAVSLRSSIAKRRSHLNAALYLLWNRAPIYLFVISYSYLNSIFMVFHTSSF